jgi:hypothetical protein
MQPSLIDWRFVPPLVELLEFLVLALLGYFLVQLIHLEADFKKNQTLLLAKMRKNVDRLRTIRRQLEKSNGQWPTLPLSISMRKKWNVICWIGKAFSAAKWARP